MNNIEKWPEAFDAQGIPKVGGRWIWVHYGRAHAFSVLRASSAEVSHSAIEGFGEGWFSGMCGSSDFTFLGFSSPAPIVAPPPSLKAAVQQEGLSIPPQAGVRHEVWEEGARLAEKEGYLDHAKMNAQQGAAVLAIDLAYDAEASAIREGRTVLKAALKEMGQGDRACFKARNLRDFEAIKSDAHKQWLWWSTGEAPAAPKGNSP